MQQMFDALSKQEYVRVNAVNRLENCVIYEI